MYITIKKLLLFVIRFSYISVNPLHYILLYFFFCSRLCLFLSVFPYEITDWTVDGLETDTKTDASSSTSTVSTTRHTSPSFITFSSDSFTTTKQTSLQSTTTTTTNAWTTPLITSRTTQITIDGFLSTDSTTTSTPLVHQRTQEISTSTTPWLTTNASSKVQTDITTKSPTSNMSSLTVTITVSVLSGVFAISIFVVVIACIRRK